MNSDKFLKGFNSEFKWLNTLLRWLKMSEERYFLPVILSDDLSKLEEQLLLISEIHTNKSHYLGGNNTARKIFNQKHYSVKTRNLYFNGDEFPSESAMKMIIGDTDAFIMKVLNRGELYCCVFVPEGFPKNPLIRFLEFGEGDLPMLSSFLDKYV
jgi:hypothetical protein